MLREAMHRSRTSFKQALNAAVRAGLGRPMPLAASPPFVVKARPLGMRAGLDPASLNKLVDDLETDAVLEKRRDQVGTRNQ